MLSAPGHLRDRNKSEKFIKFNPFVYVNYLILNEAESTVTTPEGKKTDFEEGPEQVY